MINISTDTVLILDFGSQVTQLIARRVREAGVYSEIVPFSRAVEALERMRPKGIILSGGPASVTFEDSPRADPALFEAGVPVLGICYGQQLMAAQLGGRVAAGDHSEFGRAFIEIRESCALFDGLWAPGERHQVWMSHGDRIEAIPPTFRTVAVSDAAPFAATADEQR